MKKYMVMPVLFALLCNQTASAQPGSIKGRLLNASRDSSAVAGQSVSLLKFADGMREPQVLNTARTGADGRFSFQLALVDTAVDYLLTAENQSVQYYADAIRFTDFEPAVMDIVVFDTTRSQAMVMAFMHHLFIEDAGKTLAIRETRVLNNPANKTIINSITDGHEGTALFRFALPLTAQNITPISSHFSDDLHVHGRMVYDVGAFQPGNRQISFAYEIPWQKDRAILDFEFGQMTRSFDIFLADPTLTLTGENLTDYGPFNIRGTAYQRFGIQDVRPDQRLSVQVERKTAVAKETSPLLLLAAAALLLLTGLIASRVVRRNHKRTTLSAEERQRGLKLRKSLIEKIARLEIEIENNPGEDRTQEKQNLFAELYKTERWLHQDKMGNKSDKK